MFLDASLMALEFPIPRDPILRPHFDRFRTAWASPQLRGTPMLPLTLSFQTALSVLRWLGSFQFISFRLRRCQVHESPTRTQPS